MAQKNLNNRSHLRKKLRINLGISTLSGGGYRKEGRTQRGAAEVDFREEEAHFVQYSLSGDVKNKPGDGSLPAPEKAHQVCKHGEG